MIAIPREIREAAAEVRSLQDKKAWCKQGLRYEEIFVKMLNSAGYDAEMNPDKGSNKYAPDIIVDGKLSDLKTHSTPFFTASTYGLDPQYTFTFNVKDYGRYSMFYPYIDIWVWIKFQAEQRFGIEIASHHAAYKIPFTELYELCFHAPIHSYGQRKEDKSGNARASFLIDFRDLERMEKKDGC